MDLRDARAIVTGGASGIGEACVERLQGAGAHVFVLDLASGVDVSDEAQVVAGVAAAVSELGGLDVAILNAGAGGSAPLLDLTTAEWDRIMNVNLRGSFVCLREAGKAMKQSGGAIVAVTSVSGFLTERTMAHYSASKAGLAQLVRSAARELGAYNIRVNAVAPGTTDTPMFSATDRVPGYRERVAERSALGRIGTAAEVADAVIALCELDWVTGQILAADGGVSLFSPIDPTEGRL
ncbi:MAG TPA: SDR family oxidoreductase [Acidimicrobiia bacterium]|nr:SDR family oxidoreductase [Acidimicrobiia bacterium]